MQLVLGARVLAEQLEQRAVAREGLGEQRAVIELLCCAYDLERELERGLRATRGRQRLRLGEALTRGRDLDLDLAGRWLDRLEQVLRVAARLDRRERGRGLPRPLHDARVGAREHLDERSEALP